MQLLIPPQTLELLRIELGEPVSQYSYGLAQQYQLFSSRWFRWSPPWVFPDAVFWAVSAALRSGPAVLRQVTR